MSDRSRLLGNAALTQFDVIIIGSGAGGAMAARTLALVGGKKVLVLEHGANYFVGLDDAAPDKPLPLFSNDELKLSLRGLIQQDPLLEPRSYRQSSAAAAALHPDVNTLPKTVGGAAVHADMKYPRLNAVDFRIASELQSHGINYAGANFADWPLGYDELEPFYAEAERITGVQGRRAADPFESRRSTDLPMPPGLPMYVAEVVGDGARSKGYTPFPYPSGQNSRPYRGRPACVDCGLCSGYGCPNNSKSSPAVTTLREALLSGNCQLRYESHVTRLLHDGARRVTGVEYIDGDGQLQQAQADLYVLAASAIESARLCLASDSGQGLGNSSGLVGRHLMFHTQNIAVGFYKQRLHGERGRAVTHGISDFRGVLPGGEAIDPSMPLGGITEIGTNSEAISGARNAAQALGLARLQGASISLKQLLRNSVFQAHIAVLIQQSEDAPYPGNRIDLDPSLRDVFGQPAPRITYSLGDLEARARAFYGPKLVDVHKAAGAQYGFLAPIESPPTTRHLMGTLRMGNTPQASVCDAFQKFHDLENLYAMDGAVFASSSGYNPTLTIIALALRAAANLVFPGNPERVIGRDP